MASVVYTVILDPETDPEGSGFNVRVPALPGCFTQGATVDEAMARAREAVSLYLESMIAHGEQIPVEDVTPRLESVAFDVPALASA